MTNPESSANLASFYTIEGVPEDLPRGHPILGGLLGAQPEVTRVQVDGRFYAEGQTPESIQAQHALCEDLAHQGVDYCRRKMARGVVPDKGSALDCLYVGLQGKDCCSAKQKTWIVRRVADLKDWALPTSVPHFSPAQSRKN